MVLDIEKLEQIQKDYSDLWYYINQSVQEFCPEYGVKMLTMKDGIITKEDLRRITDSRSRSQMTAEYVFRGGRFPKNVKLKDDKYIHGTREVKMEEKWNENVEACSDCGIQWKKIGKSCPVCYAPPENHLSVDNSIVNNLDILVHLNDNLYPLCGYQHSEGKGCILTILQSDVTCPKCKDILKEVNNK